MKKILFALIGLFVAASAHAQPPTKWTQRVYAVGAQQPLSAPLDLVVGQNTTCNLDPATLTTQQINPLALAWDDPTNAGKVCLFRDPGNGPLLSTPFGGSFETTLTVTNALGTSPESARLPFSHPGAILNAPTGLRPVR